MTDGAPWIWSLTADYFPDSVQVVDWYHACEHLSQAAVALHPDHPDRAQTWFNHRKENLFLGEVQAITDTLDEAGLQDQSHCFHTHRRRMRNQEFREEGYPIGSGTVESG